MRKQFTQRRYMVTEAATQNAYGLGQAIALTVLHGGAGG